MWQCLFFQTWLSRLCLPLHPFSFLLYIFSCVDFSQCFFVPCEFTVFVELYICNHRSFIHLSCSKNVRHFYAVCAIIERINPTWVCVLLFDRIYGEKIPAFHFLWFIPAWSTTVPPQDKALCTCMFICINRNDMFFFSILQLSLKRFDSAVWGDYSDRWCSKPSEAW